MSGSVRSAVVRLSADVSGLIAGYSKAKAATTDLAKTGLDGAARHRTALRDLGNQAGLMGAAVGAGVLLATKRMADFDAEMSQVKASTGATGDEFDKLRSLALDLGAKSQFSAGEAAQGITNLAKAGVSTSDIMGGALKGSLDLAAAGQLSVAAAAEDTATALTQFHLQGTAATHVADLLAAGAGKAQGEVSDMAEALKYAGVPASELGVSIEETAGTIALLAKNGIIGSQAGTSLRGLLSSLTSPSMAARKEMEKLGISVFDASGNFVGLDGVAGQLKSKMGGLTQEERANALGRIFGNQQLQAANVLYREGAKGVDEWTNKVNVSGFAADQAAAKTDNLKGDLERLGGALDSLFIGSASGANGPLRSVAQDLTHVIDAANKLPGPVKSAAFDLAGLASVVGGGTFVASRVIVGISDLRKNLDDLGPAGSKAAAGVRAVGAATVVVGGVLILKDAIDSLEKSMRDSVPGTQAMAGQLLDLSRGDVAGLGQQFNDLANSIDLLKAPGVSSLSNLLPDVAGLLPGYTSTNEQLDQLKEQLGSVDAALASIANNGSADQARTAFASLAAAYHLTGEQQKFLLSQLPQYTEALDGAANKSKLAGDGIRKVGDAGHEAARGLSDAEQAAKRFNRAMSVLQGFLDRRAALRNYDQSIRDFTKAIHDNGNAIGRQNAKAEENQAKLDAIAAAAGQVASHLKGIARVEFVSHAISQIRSLGNQLDLPPAQIQAIIGALRTLNHTDAHPNVKVDGVDQSIAGVTTLQRHITDLHGKDITITTHYVATGKGGRSVTNDTTMAGGGQVRGPGTGTSDSIPAWLSDGEYVMRAAAVNRYGPDYFHKLNNLQLADGGHVTHAPAYAPINASVMRVRGGGGYGGGGQSGPVEIEGTVTIPGLGKGKLTGWLARQVADIAVEEIRDERRFLLNQIRAEDSF